jgi:hypothetical protein
MALMAVGLAIGWAGASVADGATGGLPLCQATLGTCTTNLTTCDANLGSCNTSLATCTADLGTCNADLTQAVADLSACTTELAAAQKFPATGQTTCWNTAGSVIVCAGTGQDGEIQAGATLSYTDNGDGTITDNNTGLMWEKKSDDGTIHDKVNFYTWANAFAVHIAGLNAGGGFAGYTDWRLPNVKELQSIVNYQNVNPSVSSAFNTGCVATCTVLTCSCTIESRYWSSSTVANSPTFAWIVLFDFGSVNFVIDNGKSNGSFVRAVRGGL